MPNLFWLISLINCTRCSFVELYLFSSNYFFPGYIREQGYSSHSTLIIDQYNEVGNPHLYFFPNSLSLSLSLYHFLLIVLNLELGIGEERLGFAWATSATARTECQCLQTKLYGFIQYGSINLCGDFFFIIFLESQWYFGDYIGKSSKMLFGFIDCCIQQMDL